MNEQPKFAQEHLIELACKRKASVLREIKEDEETLAKQRRERMVSEKKKRDALQSRIEKETNELSKLHLITTADELTQALVDIDQEKLSAPKKTAKKIALLRTQVKI